MLTYIFLTLLFVSDVDGDEELDVNISSNGIGRRLPSSRQQHSSHRSVQRVTESRLENVRPGQMIRTKEFGVLWATFFLNTQVVPRIGFLTRATASANPFDLDAKKWSKLEGWSSCRTNLKIAQLCS